MSTGLLFVLLSCVLHSASGYELNSRHQIEDTGITWGEVPRETTRELEGDLTRRSGPTHLLSSPSTAEVQKNVGEIAISPVSLPVLFLYSNLSTAGFAILHSILHGPWEGQDQPPAHNRGAGITANTWDGVAPPSDQHSIT